MMNAFRIATSFLALCLGALVMLLVAIPTAFLARRLYSEVIARSIGMTVLRIWGVRVETHYLASLPHGQKVYISNHQSTLDIFVLIALGLPRTRFFISGYLQKVLPLGLIGHLIRVFWTVPQEFPEQRRRIFVRAERILRRTGDSVYLSPEGMRVATGSIGAFNKGSFHLATSLGAPIVPLYFRIPAASDPGRGYVARPGLIELYVLPALHTATWHVDDVPANRDRVHELYCRVHAHVREAGALPEDLSLAEHRVARDEVMA